MQSCLGFRLGTSKSCHHRIVFLVQNIIAVNARNSQSHHRNSHSGIAEQAELLLFIFYRIAVGIKPLRLMILRATLIAILPVLVFATGLLLLPLVLLLLLSQLFFHLPAQMLKQILTSKWILIHEIPPYIVSVLY